MIRKASAGDASRLEWFKSSYSNSSEADSCVEVALDWHKSSYSDSGSGSECVEVAATPATVHVRDSKDLPGGPTLAFAPAAWTAFLAHAPTP